MTKTGRDPLSIIFISLLLVALFGLSSGYGQNRVPIPSTPGALERQPPESEASPAEPEDQPTEREETPVGPEDQPEREAFPDPSLDVLIPLRPTTGSSRLLENLLNAPETSRLFIQVSLGVDYSNNFDQEDEDTEQDARTVLSVGTRYRVRGKGRYLSLANSINANYQVDNGILNIGFTNLALDMGYDFPRLSLSLKDSFVRDDNLELANETGTSRERTTFLRNTLNPRIRFKLNRVTTFDLAYTNTLVFEESSQSDDQEEDDSGDSVTDRFQATLNHKFTRTIRGGVGYTITRNDDANSDPAYEFAMAANASYDLTRALSLSANASWAFTNREPADTDALTYGGRISVRYQLLPELTLVIGAGITLFDDEEGDPDLFLNGELGLNGTLEIVPGTRLRLTSNQDIVNTQGEVENSGIVLRRTFRAQLEQDITRTILLRLFATMAFNEFLEQMNDDETDSDGNRKEFFWTTGANLSYQLTRALSFNLEYQRRQRDANRAEDEFVENRVLFRLSAGFSAL